MITCHEIFHKMSPGLADSIFTHLHDTEKAGYQSAIGTLAQQNHLRPIFVARKPKEERHRWIQQALSRRPSDELASNVLQVWLVATQTAMLCSFLDALGITHDERGMIEDLPPAPDAEKIEQAVSALLALYPREEVAVYLNAFQAMDENGWETLQQKLETDPRLALGAAE